MASSAFAPAKVNLTLHVTGRRADGYHLLDSLVVFAGVGDRVDLAPAARTSVAVSGPEADGVPTGPENIVVRAAESFGTPVHITLHKELPNAAGLGGGSSDAAATLRALGRMTGRPVPDALTLGADVPVCVLGRPARMSGIGEVLAPVAGLPAAWLVLVNPREMLATGAVFAALDRVDGPAMGELRAWTDAADLAAWLAARRNDLEAPATRIAPAVGDALAALRATEGCLLARMSGSGATCFGLYATLDAAEAAAATLGARNPDWWVRAAEMLRQPVGADDPAEVS